MKPAFAYLRTSSNTNVGTDKDSDKRQRQAIHQYAKRSGYSVVREFYDAGVSGADPVGDRPGFREMLKELNGTSVILVENATRFARDLMVQEVGYQHLKAMGVELIACDKPESFLDDSPTGEMIRQLMGVMAQFQKATTVLQLRQARDRKRATGVKVEGRKSYAESNPALVKLARKLRGRKNPKSLGHIARLLEEAGHTTAKGNRYSASAVSSMLNQRVRRA